ncbi:TPA: hypothetical protein ENS27_19980, partial [bacterium]|nr:hypothetical protein [bacterium]
MQARILVIISFIIMLSFSSMVIAMPQINASVTTEFGIYSPYIVNVTPNVTPYTIKPDLSNISNSNKFNLTAKEKELLAKNGFVAS